MTLDSAMLACSVVMEGALLGILMRRGNGSRLPWFCVYIAWSLVSEVAGWLVMGRFPALYVRFYLYETAVHCALQFAVPLELCWSVLRCIHAQLDKRNVWLAGAILFLAGTMLWPWAGTGLPQNITATALLLLHLQLTSSLLRIVCLASDRSSEPDICDWLDRVRAAGAGGPWLVFDLQRRRGAGRFKNGSTRTASGFR
jgi:hypothetical protein